MNKPMMIQAERLQKAQEEFHNMTVCRDHWKTSYETLKTENTHLQAQNAELREALEEIIARCELHILDDDIHADNYYEAKAALASPGSKLLEELRRLREFYNKFHVKDMPTEAYAELVCTHINIQKYHDNSILCKDCHEVIWQGKTLLEPIPDHIREVLDEAKEGAEDGKPSNAD